MSRLLPLFVGVSFAALLLTRPLVKKFSTPKIQRTNIDRIIGERAIVTEEIDNLRAIGIVKADGKSWSARSADGSIIPAGSVVEVQKIDGVKLIVGIIQNKKKEEIFFYGMALHYFGGNCNCIGYRYS